VTRVLVTGANGFVGHHLCRGLIDGGYEVVALVHRHRERLPSSASLQVVPGDVLDPASLLNAMRRHGPIAAVAHLATEPPERPKESVAGLSRRETNVSGTENVLHAACRADVQRVVFTSTMSVFDFLDPDLPIPLKEQHPVAPRDPYGVEKSVAEGICRRVTDDAGLPVVILRLAGVYGPGKRSGAVYNFLRSVLQAEAIHIAADRGVDLLWVDDAVDAVIRALAADVTAGTLHVGSGQAVPLSTIAQAATCIVGGEEQRTITVQAPGNSFCLDITRAAQRLGFQPTGLNEALADFVPSVARDLGLAWPR
jgi:nucleoside-diphosphate-sugar epimerase